MHLHNQLHFKSMIALFLVCTFSVLSQSWGIEKIEPDQRAVKLINHFMHALQSDDDSTREKQVIRFLHKSMLTRTGLMTSSLKRFSYQKACDGVKFYTIPVQITEVHKGRMVTIGFKETAERGRIDKYFIAKKEGVAGRPAPLHVFWPEKGGSPTLVNIGSL